MGNVMVLAGRTGKDLTDTTFEMIGAARQLANAWGGQVEVALFGTADPAAELGAADTVVSIDHPALSDYVPEAYEVALRHVLEQRSPRLLLLPNDTVGLDLGSALSVDWQAPQAAYVVGLQADGDLAVATCQILGGKIMAEVELPGDRGICTIVAGAFPAAAGHADGEPTVVTLDPPAGLDSPRTSLQQLIEPEGGDVDITTATMLVSVGRGIGSKDDLDTVQEFADALGVPLSASRPVIDSGWLPKSRQVGKSGLKVKPKAYLMFGISGAPEHLEGMRDAELIIACNTDANAPIFDVAHYGTTCDLFDLAPALVEKLEG
jgi:electron transfer flavoprotein alpha subunit